MDKPVDGAEAHVSPVVQGLCDVCSKPLASHERGHGVPICPGIFAPSYRTRLTDQIAALVADNERMVAEVERLKRPTLFWIDEDPESGYCDPWEALEAALYHSDDEGIAAIRTGRELGIRFYGRLRPDDEIGIECDWTESFATKAEADAAIAAERSRRQAARTALETRNG